MVGWQQRALGTLDSLSRLHDSLFPDSDSHWRRSRRAQPDTQGMFHVKHESARSPIDPEQVRTALAACGVQASREQCSLLARHAELVRKANESMNLTRITDSESMVHLHIVDSLAFLPYVSLPEGRLIDVGSGAGYPGIPLAIMGHQVTLCESVKKKAAFLDECVHELQLPADVSALRAEELAQTVRGSSAGVIFRAVSALPSLVELAAPLLAAEGRMIALKGRVEDSEAAAGAAAARLCGMALESRDDYTLVGGEARTVLCFRREGRPLVKLPRRPGMAQRHPLA